MLMDNFRTFPENDLLVKAMMKVEASSQNEKWLVVKQLRQPKVENISNG